jgi:hypothetical protein
VLPLLRTRDDQAQLANALSVRVGAKQAQQIDDPAQCDSPRGALQRRHLWARKRTQPGEPRDTRGARDSGANRKRVVDVCGLRHSVGAGACRCNANDTALEAPPLPFHPPTGVLGGLEFPDQLFVEGRRVFHQIAMEGDREILGNPGGIKCRTGLDDGDGLRDAVPSMQLTTHRSIRSENDTPASRPAFGIPRLNFFGTSLPRPDGRSTSESGVSASSAAIASARARETSGSRPSWPTAHSSDSHTNTPVSLASSRIFFARRPSCTVPLARLNAKFKGMSIMRRLVASSYGRDIRPECRPCCNRALVLISTAVDLNPGASEHGDGGDGRGAPDRNSVTDLAFQGCRPRALVVNV